MELNVKDEGIRKCISVQLSVDLDAITKPNETTKNAIKFLDSINLPHTLDYIGYERIRRAAEKIRREHPDFKGDLGFKHYTLQDVPQNTLDKIEKFDPNDVFTDNDILQQFGRETVLATWLVRDGYGFDGKAADLNLSGYTAFLCGSHIYFVNEGFDENAMIALIDRYHSDASFNPQNIVLFGYSFDPTQTEVLKRNLKTLEDSAKNLKINFEIRY